MQIVPASPDPSRPSRFLLRTGLDSRGNPKYWDAGCTPHLLVTGDDDACGRTLGRVMLGAAASGWKLVTVDGGTDPVDHVLDELMRSFRFRQEALAKSEDRYGYRTVFRPVVVLVDRFEHLIDMATRRGVGQPVDGSVEDESLYEKLYRLIHAGGSLNLHILAQVHPADIASEDLLDDSRLFQLLNVDEPDDTGRLESEREHPSCRHDDEPGLPLFPPVTDDDDPIIPNLFDHPTLNDLTADTPKTDGTVTDEESERFDQFLKQEDEDDRRHQLRVGIDSQNRMVYWDASIDPHLILRGDYEQSSLNTIGLDAQAKGWMLTQFNVSPTGSPDEDEQRLHTVEQSLDFIRRHYDDATPLPLLVIIEGLPELRNQTMNTRNSLPHIRLSAKRIISLLRQLIEEPENDVHLLFASHCENDPRSFANLTITGADGTGEYMSPTVGYRTPVATF